MWCACDHGSVFVGVSGGLKGLLTMNIEPCRHLVATCCIFTPAFFSDLRHHSERLKSPAIPAKIARPRAMRDTIQRHATDYRYLSSAALGRRVCVPCRRWARPYPAHRRTRGIHSSLCSWRKKRLKDATQAKRRTIQIQHTSEKVRASNRRQR